MAQIEKVNTEGVAAELLRRLPGWDTLDEAHRVETPRRFVSMLMEMCTQTDYDAKFKTFPADGLDEMVALGPIPFYTLCAHHVVPFYGNAWVGYVPKEVIAGLSKFDRVVKGIAKGLWVQEELTSAIAVYLEDHLEPRGVAVILEGEHLCMAMRGTKQPGVITRTSSMRGVFADHDRTAKAEFMEFVRVTR